MPRSPEKTGVDFPGDDAPRPRRTYVRRAHRFTLPVIAAMMAVAVGGCATTPGALPDAFPTAPSPTVDPTAAPSRDDVVEIVVVGDSLATGDGYDATLNDPGSWQMHLSPDVEVIGGWWRDGATALQMANNVPVSSGEVLVVMAGTNDVGRDIPRDETIGNVRRITEKVRADEVILCAIPPFERNRREAMRLNADLEALAAENGWRWLDPWEFYRDGDGWLDDASTDGVHPAEPVYESAGLLIGEAVLDAGGGPSTD